MTDALWRTLEELFRSWTGMCVPDTMRPTALRVVARMARDTEREPIALLRAVDREPELRQELLDRVALGTTWFLREEAGLLSLVSNLRRSMPRDQPVLVWSAGCSSGEEPYSLAMALAEAGVPARILATDLNRRALRHGSEGHYPRRAITRLPAHWRSRYFQDAGPDTVRVIEAIRRCVSFELHNFHADQALPAGWHRFDAVVCRNALIYFERDEAMALIGQLAARCRPGGYLLLSAVERPLFWMHNVSTAHDTAELVQISSVQPRVPPAVPVSIHEQPTPRIAAPGVLDPERPAGKPRSDAAVAADLLTRAEAAEHAGHLDQAMSLLDLAATRAPLAAEVHLARGLILKRMGRMQEAIDALRAARFLDDHAWLAPYQLALCLEATGEQREAREAYRHALGVLEAGGPPGLARPSAAVETLATTVAEVCRNRIRTRAPG